MTRKSNVRSHFYTNKNATQKLNYNKWAKAPMGWIDDSTSVYGSEYPRNTSVGRDSSDYNISDENNENSSSQNLRKTLPQKAKNHPIITSAILTLLVNLISFFVQFGVTNKSSQMKNYSDKLSETREEMIELRTRLNSIERLIDNLNHIEVDTKAINYQFEKIKSDISNNQKNYERFEEEITRIESRIDSILFSINDVK